MGNQAIPCRIFALIVGIDRYLSVSDLNGCVNDATSIRAFVLDQLHVPEDQITFLVNEEATRDAIISGFKNMISNPSIQNGDAIIVYYAGHGTRIEAPPKWPSTDGKIEAICPHDERTTDDAGEYIDAIPDRTINTLLHELAAAKGNNITVIFDCCHSGGITRNATERDEDVFRCVINTRPIPATLDDDIWGPHSARAAQSDIPAGFLHNYMSSHVLLAACRQEERAREYTLPEGLKCGFFTHGLLKCLRATSLGQVTYAQLHLFLPTASDQHPQCEGTNKHRFLFDNKISTTRPNTFALTQKGPGVFEVGIGSVQGVVMGTEFTVIMQGASSHILSASSTDVHSATLIPSNGDKALTLPPGTKATVSDWNNVAVTLKVFLSPSLDTSISDSLFPERKVDLSNVEEIKQKRKFRKFREVDSHDMANVALNRHSNGEFVVERLDTMIPKHASPEVHFQTASLDLLPSVFDAIAHFHYFLGRQLGTDHLKEQVKLEMHRLVGELGESFLPDADSVSLFVDGAAKFQLDENAKYGFAISNSSPHDLFPYLFYFDPSTYSIDTWYIPPSRTMAPPLRAQDGANRITIGYGAGGGFPFTFSIPDNQTLDSGFLKLFVSTVYLDLEWIEQPSPFKCSQPTRKLEQREFPVIGAWDAVVTVYVEGAP